MIVIYLLACYGLTFLLKNSNGPFNIIANFRNWLFRNKLCGLFFYELFSCYFCLGIWSSFIALLLSYFFIFSVYVLAGAAFTYFLSLIANLLISIFEKLESK